MVKIEGNLCEINLKTMEIEIRKYFKISQLISYGTDTLVINEFALIMGTKLSLVTKLLFVVFCQKSLWKLLTPLMTPLI